MNAKQLKRPVCIMTMHQQESFLGGGGIKKWAVQCWNSQKLDHEQLFEISRAWAYSSKIDYRAIW